MHPHGNTERAFYHFSFLRDIKIHGIYFNTIARYLSLYPFIKKPHFHDFYTILLIDKGTGGIKICNDNYTVEQHSIFLIAPNQMHSLDGLENVEGKVFFFCQDFYVEEFSFIRLLNVFSYTSPDEKENCSPGINLSDNGIIPVKELLKSVEQEYEMSSKGDNSGIIIRSLLNIILLRLSNLFESKSGNGFRNDNKIIHSLSHLVESNFIQERQIGFYTSAFNITEKHLNDICNRNFKCGLKKILHDRIMQESRRLLLSSDFSVAEIAYKLNFQDNSYFNKVFRKSTGLTPKRFREMHRKLIP